MSTLNSVLTAVLMNTTTKIMSAFGIGFVSYTGLDYMQDRFVYLIQDKLGDLSEAALQLLYIAGLGEFLNYQLSAWAVVLTLKSGSHLTARMRAM